MPETDSARSESPPEASLRSWWANGAHENSPPDERGDLTGAGTPSEHDDERQKNGAAKEIGPSDIQDRDGGVLVMATLFGLHPFLLKLYADGGYQGVAFQAGLKRVMRSVELEIVKRSDAVKGFAVLPRRWIVERKALAFLRLASIRMMLRKLCQKTLRSRTDTKD